MTVLSVSQTYSCLRIFKKNTRRTETGVVSTRSLEVEELRGKCKVSRFFSRNFLVDGRLNKIVKLILVFPQCG